MKTELAICPEYQPLTSSITGNDLFSIAPELSLVVFIGASSDYIEDVVWYEKGSKFPRHQNELGWEELSWYVTPSTFFRLLEEVIIDINTGARRFSDNALQKYLFLFRACLPKVLQNDPDYEEALIGLRNL